MTFPQSRPWPRTPEAEARVKATATDLTAKLDAYWREAEKRGAPLPPQDFLEALIRATARLAMTGGGYRFDRFDHEAGGLAEACVAVWRDEIRTAALATAQSRGVR